MSSTSRISRLVRWSDRSIAAERGQQPAREDVRLDPVRAASLRLVRRRPGTRSICRLSRPPGHERPVAGLEERREVLGADGLEHLDRDDGVVRAVDRRGSRAARRSTRSASPAAATRSVARSMLRRRDRDRRHAAAELAGGVEREAAPAACRSPGRARHRAGPARSAMTAYLLRCASASDCSGVAKTALE